VRLQPALVGRTVVSQGNIHQAGSTNGVMITCVRVAGLGNAGAAGAGLRNPLAHAVGADVVDGALVAIVAILALVGELHSAFACSAVVILISCHPSQQNAKEGGCAMAHYSWPTLWNVTPCMLPLSTKWG
jgi:hypothetical protein